MSIIRKNNKQEFTIAKSRDDVFRALQAAGHHVGKVVSEMPTTGTLRVKITKVALVNPTTIRVSCERIDDNNTRVRLDSEALDGMIGLGSAGRSLDAYLEAVEAFASGNQPKPPPASTKMLLAIAALVALGLVFLIWLI